MVSNVRDIAVCFISRCGIAVSSWSVVCGIWRFGATVYGEIQISLAYVGIPVFSKTLLLFSLFVSSTKTFLF